MPNDREGREDKEAQARGDGCSLNPSVGGPPLDFVTTDLSALERKLYELLYASDDWA